MTGMYPVTWVDHAYTARKIAKRVRSWRRT
jgi:hypothetical protein